LSFVGLVGVIQKNKTLVRNYASFQFLLTIICLISSVLFIFRWAEFAGASIIGLSTYYEQEWPNLMRYVHFDEFNDDGMSSCPGGKYFQTINLESDYRFVNCTDAVKDFPELASKKD